MACRVRSFQRLERGSSLLAAATTRQTPLYQPICLQSLLTQRKQQSRLSHTSQRKVHSTTRQSSSISATPLSSSPSLLPPASPPPPPALLSRLPLTTVLRTYIITTLSSSSFLLRATLFVLLKILSSTNPILSIDRNPFLLKLLKSTIYAQFCAGETKRELRGVVAEAKGRLGYDGVILEYALEVLENEGQTKEVKSAEEEEALAEKEIEHWKRGMLDSLEVASEGDFVGFKWSGLGHSALHRLNNLQPPTPSMSHAIHSALTLAKSKRVSLLPGAEMEVTNPGLELWNRDLQRQYNTPDHGTAVLYTTYQCYLKAIPARISRDIEAARQGGYIAGVKLVRGAYLTSEPRQLIWDTKEDTDKCYDACTEGVVSREWNDAITPAESNVEKAFPMTDVVLATHNSASIETAERIRDGGKAGVEANGRLTYAQLQGMSDDLSQGLLQQAKDKKGLVGPGSEAKVVKLLTFGTVKECLNFLIRRAAENQESAGRTGDTARAMGREILRRVRVGLRLE